MSSHTRSNSAIRKHRSQERSSRRQGVLEGAARVERRDELRLEARLRGLLEAVSDDEQPRFVEAPPEEAHVQWHTLPLARGYGDERVAGDGGVRGSDEKVVWIAARLPLMCGRVRWGVRVRVCGPSGVSPQRVAPAPVEEP